MVSTKRVCAPGAKGDSISCFSRDALIKMASALDERKVFTSYNKKKLWEYIRRKLSDRCKTEICWVDQDFAKNLNDPEISIETFRPEMPDEWKNDPKMWLTNYDIDLVMSQYEKQYRDFLFLGPVPSDCPNGFSCELTNFSPVRLLKSGGGGAESNKRRVGIVYNLDKHNQPGSHWVSVFIDLSRKDKKEVSYYDSTGHPPPPSIYNFLKQTVNKLTAAGYPTVLNINDKRHQRGNTECGIYCMNYLIERLKGKSWRQAVNKKIPDSKMNQMRNYLFRKGG